MMMVIVTIMIALPPEGVAGMSTDVFNWLLIIIVIHLKSNGCLVFSTDLCGFLLFMFSPFDADLNEKQLSSVSMSNLYSFVLKDPFRWFSVIFLINHVGCIFSLLYSSLLLCLYHQSCHQHCSRLSSNEGHLLESWNMHCSNPLLQCYTEFLWSIIYAQSYYNLIAACPLISGHPIPAVSLGARRETEAHVQAWLFEQNQHKSKHKQKLFQGLTSITYLNVKSINYALKLKDP